MIPIEFPVCSLKNVWKCVLFVCNTAMRLWHDQISTLWIHPHVQCVCICVKCNGNEPSRTSESLPTASFFHHSNQSQNMAKYKICIPKISFKFLSCIFPCHFCFCVHFLLSCYQQRHNNLFLFRRFFLSYAKTHSTFYLQQDKLTTYFLLPQSFWNAWHFFQWNALAFTLQNCAKAA